MGHLQGELPCAGEAQRDRVNADVGLALPGSQKVELMHSNVHHHVAATLHEVTPKGLHGGDGAVVAEQSACSSKDLSACRNGCGDGKACRGEAGFECKSSEHTEARCVRFVSLLCCLNPSQAGLFA